MTDSRSSTFLVAGQIATAIVGVALGAVLTLMLVLDRPQSDSSPPQTPPPTPRPPVTVPRFQAPPVAPPAPPAETIPDTEDQTLSANDNTPTPPPPAPHHRTISRASAGYAVQAGAFLSRGAADRLAQQLTAQGQAAAVYRRRDASGHVLNIVRLTQIFASRAAAAERGHAVERDLRIKTLVAPVQP